MTAIIYKHSEPILRPYKNIKAIFNPAAFQYKGKTYLLARIIKEYKRYASALFLYEGEDFVNFKEVGEVVSPLEPYESWGCEDPRVTRIGRSYYITYTALSEYTWNPDKIPRVGLIRTSEPNRAESYEKIGLISPPYVEDKNLVILPKRIKGYYVIIHRPFNWVRDKIKKIGGKFYMKAKGKWWEWPFSEEPPYSPNEFPRKPSIWIAKTKKLKPGAEWKEHKILWEPREEWEQEKVGAGIPPIETKDGWLLIYHGVGRLKEGIFGVRFDGEPQKVIYRAGALLLDKEDPSKVRAFSKHPILEPEAWFEVRGDVPYVVFPTGGIKVKNKLYVYYGAADSYIGLVVFDLKKLLASLYKL